VSGGVWALPVRGAIASEAAMNMNATAEGRAMVLQISIGRS
jgi:hypothetical protein